MPTESFTSAALAVSSATGVLMPTESFTSSALAVSSATATLGFVTAFSLYDERGFYVKIDPTGVSVTKATSFGGSQSALTFPISRDDALSLARSLLHVAN